VKESSKLELDGFDGMATDEGHPEGKGTNQSPSEEVDEDGEA